MKKAVLFNEFALQCPYFTRNTDVNNGYGCKNPDSINKNELNIGHCSCELCLFGIPAEQEDFDNPEYSRNIDWNGLCENGKVVKEILLLDVDEDTTDDIKQINDMDCHKQKEKPRHNIMKKLWLKIPFYVRYRCRLIEGAIKRFINHIKYTYRK